MAGEFKNFDGAVAKFNKDHGVSFSFEYYETELKKTLHMREFFTGGSKLSAEDYIYRTVVAKLYREAVVSAIAKKVKSVDHSAFFKDFEKLMDNYREYCAKKGSNPPSKNGGWHSGVDIVNAMQKKIADIPSDKSDFIKNNYIKRSLRLRDMRADIDGMGKNGNSVTAEELSRVIVYAKALENTIKERSGWWRAIHWFQGPAEKRDLEAFNKFIDQYRNSDIYKKAEEFANENVVGKANKDLEQAKQEIAEKEMLKPRRLKEKKLGMERMTNKKVNEHLHKQILGAIERSTSKEADKNAVARGLILVGNKGIIQKMWNAFENATTVEEKEKVINTHTQQIFNDTFNSIKKLKGMNEHDSIVATQKITDMMLKQYSPVTSDKAYDKYADNYIVNDEKFMDSFVRNNFKDMSDEQIKNMINDIKLDASTKKEKLKISNDVVSSNDVKKSEKHIDVPKLESQVKSN